MNRFYLAALLLTDPVLESLRRELRRLSDATASTEDLAEALKHELIKREVLEGEKADVAVKKVAKASNRALRAVRKDRPEDATGAVEPETETPAGNVEGV